MKRLAFALVIMLLAGVATAREFDTNDRRGWKLSSISGLRIDACTWLSNSGRMQEKCIPVRLRNRSIIYVAENDYDRAIANVDTPVRLRPDDVVAHDFFTWDLTTTPRSSARNDVRGIQVASRAVPNSDQLFEVNDHVAYADRGNGYFKKHQYDRAIADYDAAIRLKPDFATPYYNRGLAHGHKRRYHLAAADFSSVIRLELDHVRALNSLAWLLATAPLASVRNGSRAIESALRAVSLRDTAEYRDTLAAAYAEAGRFAEAVRGQERAIDMARQEGISDLADWEYRLRLYERGQPFRE